EKFALRQHFSPLKIRISQAPCGARSRWPDRTAWNHEALVSPRKGRRRYFPPPPAKSSIERRIRRATQPMLPARSVLPPGPQQERSHHFAKLKTDCCKRGFRGNDFALSRKKSAKQWFRKKLSRRGRDWAPKNLGVKRTSRRAATTKLQRNAAGGLFARP
ncbi:MAG: hypothetical protein H6Q43_3594, partial [Deltaproteobacteria bacterium]|nr:hypothetical protein [Deltaproteobacteria bacterium]